MEAWVGAIAEQVALVPVAHLVLRVTHLVVHDDEVTLGHLGALLDAKVTNRGKNNL